MPQQTSRDASFVVRIWWEDRNQYAEPPIWRGQVQHAGSGEATGFRSMGELWNFLRRWTGAQTRESDSPDQQPVTSNQ